MILMEMIKYPRQDRRDALHSGVDYTWLFRITMIIILLKMIMRREERRKKSKNAGDDKPNTSYARK